MADFGHRWRISGLSAAAQSLLGAAWADSTSKRYKSAWSRWVRWCVRGNHNPLGCEVVTIMNFLASLASQGLVYSTINSYRSAISAGHLPVEGHPVGEHPLICKLLRGVHLSLPPEPRYSALWDVNKVLRLFQGGR